MNPALCVGLSFEETALFAGLLSTATAPHKPHILHRSSDVLHTALINAFKTCDEPARKTLSHTLRTRLYTSHTQPLPKLHTEWHTHLQKTERPDIVLCLQEPPPTSIPKHIVAWVRAEFAQQHGLRDPRLSPHLPLEFGSLYTLPPHDLQSLSMYLGLALSSRILHTLGKRLLASLLQALGEPLSRLFLDLLRDPPDLDSVLLRIGRRHFSRLGQNPEISLPQHIQSAGNTLLVCALAFRSPSLVRSIAHSLPYTHGEALLNRLPSTQQNTLLRQASPHAERLFMLLSPRASRHQLTVRDLHTKPIVFAPAAL